MRGFLDSLFVVGKNRVKKALNKGIRVVDNIKEEAAELDEKESEEIHMKILAFEKKYDLSFAPTEYLVLYTSLEYNDMEKVLQIIDSARLRSSLSN